MLDILEYPATSKEGIAYVFHVENWADPKAAFHDIQYSFSEHGIGSASVKCPFLSHTEVDFESNPFICKNSSSNTPAERLTRVLYSNVKQHEKGHISLQIKEGVDINLLKLLFANEGRISNQDDTNCNKLYPLGSHQKYCSSTQKIKLQRVDYSVEFKMLTSLNLQRFPFVILISKGIHTHPPPPSKTPTCIKSELKKLIENSKEQLIDITAQQ
ncbi:hypothetical protein C1645_838961 [Glomus cerebriforme]|uniref:Uncharacterized protein n=1 Tax=Glomus cerebriforme TaxID=658196 RepID=A0A397S473_9GLOM|nr:hypothetical protein C1645_838961 [Glomus cerebriforme]